MARTSLVDQVILILIDDVRASHLFDLMTKGKLPNIAQIAKNGISSQNCITSYPTKDNIVTIILEMKSPIPVIRNINS